MRNRVTLKTVADGVLNREPSVKSCELVRAREGYFYLTGKFVDGKPFVTAGIYTYRLGNGWSFDEWVEECTSAIREQME